MALLTGVLAVSFNALSVSDVDPETGDPYIKSTLEGIAAYEEAEGMDPGTLGYQTIYFQMPNGKTGPVADEDVNLHHEDVLDPDTGDVITPAYDEIVIHKGEKAPSWYNENNVYDGKNYAGVYWWGGPAATDGAWVGYRMDLVDEEQGIFCAYIPYDPDDPGASVVMAIFNNGVDGGTDSSKPIFFQAAQTVDTNIEGAWPGDYETLPEGSPDEFSFDNCIYVVNPDTVSINAFSQKQECGANWYVYYGNGCYGQYYEGCDEFTGDVDQDCCNPDHFKDGVHVGYQGDTPDQPTEVPAPEPVVQNDETTNISVEAVTDGTLTVEKKNINDVNYVVQGRKLALYDISLIKDGAAVQPDGNALVKIPCTDSTAKVYRVEADGSVTDMNAVYQDGFLVFTTDHFSLYATVGSYPELESNKLYFDTNGTGWEMGTKNKVAFHIFGGDIENGSAWGAKKSIGKATTGLSGVFEFDPVATYGYTFTPGVQYKIIFVRTDGANWTNQTYDLLFTVDCFGHVAFCDGTEYENPVDSSKKTLATFWYNMDSFVVGPVKQISSIGNVVGTCLAEGTTDESLFNDFLTVVDDTTGKTKYENAYQFVVDANIKTEQQMIDDIGEGLNLTKQQIYDAFAASGVEGSTWDYTASSLPGDVVIPTEAPTEPEPIVIGECGDVDGDGEISILDVTIMQRVLANKSISASLDPAVVRKLGDVDNNGTLDAVDVTLLQRWLLGLNQDLPIGRSINAAPH